MASWRTATARTPAMDKAADAAFRKARQERDKLADAWHRAMTRATYTAGSEAEKKSALEYASKLSAKADDQEQIIAAARAYAKLPASHASRLRTRASRGRSLWVVDYRSVWPDGRGLWHVGVVRALTAADAVAAVRRIEHKRGLTIERVSVAQGRLRGYPESRVIDA